MRRPASVNGGVGDDDVSHDGQATPASSAAVPETPPVMPAAQPPAGSGESSGIIGLVEGLCGFGNVIL